MEIFKNIATVVGCISAIFGLSTAIIKPLRQWIIESFTRKTRQTELSKKIDEVNKKLDQSLVNDEDLNKRLTRVERNVLENEADRLKSELSMYYNRCCRGMQIFPEEMSRVDEAYDKYHNKLGLNHIGTHMYDEIEKYYKQQDFIKINND